MRKKFVFDRNTKGFIEVSPSWEEKGRTHAVIQDSMDPLEHPANGKIYDSKKEFRRVTKLHGLEELGNERRGTGSQPAYQKVSEADYVDAVKSAWAQLDSGTAPLNEYEREVCRRNDERLRNR